MQQGWSRVSELFASAFKREVKTPLGFFFRLVGAVAAIVLVSLFLFSSTPEGDQVKLHLIYTTMLAFGAMFVVVVVFAWFRPKNLVYGESGHRAEVKLHYGTDKLALTNEQLSVLPRLQNVRPTAELVDRE